MGYDGPSGKVEGGEKSHAPAGEASGLQAFAVLGQFLEEDGWFPQRVEDKFAYRTYYHGEHGGMLCYALIRVDWQKFLFYAIAPFNVAEEKRPAVAEYITRANYGLPIGNFEMDYSDGEVRYRCSLDFEGVALTPSLVKNIAYPAVYTMDYYLPGLMKVVFGDHSPLEAIEEVERGVKPPAAEEVEGSRR
ncbi:MAG: YbjN domain-containing protein [Chloroflexaceae bacterium]|nr:YbjN domain-containing protein [Chloroflexaceae bacterium]